MRQVIGENAVPSESYSTSSSEDTRRQQRKSAFRAALNRQSRNSNDSEGAYSSAASYFSGTSQVFLDRSPCVSKDSSDAPNGLPLETPPFPNSSEIKESIPSETCQHEQTDEGPFTSIEMILGNLKMHNVSEGMNDKNPIKNNKDESHSLKELHTLSISSTITSERNDGLSPLPPKRITEVAADANIEVYLESFSRSILPNTKGDDYIFIPHTRVYPVESFKEAIVRVGLRDIKRKSLLMHLTKGKSKSLSEEQKTTRWRNILLSGLSKPDFSMHNTCSIRFKEKGKCFCPITEIQVRCPESHENVSAKVSAFLAKESTSGKSPNHPLMVDITPDQVKSPMCSIIDDGFVVDSDYRARPCTATLDGSAFNCTLKCYETLGVSNEADKHTREDSILSKIFVFPTNDSSLACMHVM